MQLNGQKFRRVSEQLSFTPKFSCWKCKKMTFFWKRWLQTGLPDLKTPNKWNFALGRFLCIFKNIVFFEIFPDFWNSLVPHARMVKCTLFYLNIVGQTQQNLISPFLTKKKNTTAEHFRFQCESLKLNLMALFFFFFNSQNRTVSANE